MTVPDLSLVPPTPALLAQALEWRNHPAVTRWLITTVADPPSWTASWLGSLEDPDDHAFLAVLDGRAVATGTLGVGDAPAQSHVLDPPSTGSEGRLGYLVDPAYAGRGIGTAVASALLRIAFDEVGLHRVQASCFADNTASWRVMEKAGMRREQHTVRDTWHAERGWVDGYTYAILGEEWTLVR